MTAALGDQIRPMPGPATIAAAQCSTAYTAQAGSPATPEDEQSWLAGAPPGRRRTDYTLTP